MGQFSSTKDEEIENEEGENEYLKFSSSNIKGWKKQNNNTFISQISLGEQKNFDIFCIFNGLNGNEVSKFMKNHFSKILLENIKNSLNNIKEAINNTFLRMNKLMEEKEEEIIELKLSNLKEESKNYKIILNEQDLEIKLTKEEKEDILKYTGCTACLILLDEKNKTLYFGNIGNSEVIVYKKNDTSEKLDPEVFASKHRPTDDLEKKRIKNEFIINDKLYGVLNVCRAFGCFEYKNDFQILNKTLSDEPDISIYNLKDEDEFIFIGTESIIECIDKQKFGDLIKNKTQENDDDLTKALNEIIKDNIEYDFYNNDTEFGFDNITSTLIKIKSIKKKN